MDPKELLLYYTAVFFVAALVIMRRRPRRGMLLKIRKGSPTKSAGGKNYSDLAKQFKLEGPIFPLPFLCIPSSGHLT